MLEYSKDGITITPILDTRRQLKSGAYPVKIRVTYNRERKYYATGKELSSHEWDVLLTTKNKELSRIRKDIENSFELVREAAEELAYRGDFSHARLLAHLRNSCTTSISDMLLQICEELRAEKRIRTAEVYNNVLVSLRRWGKEDTALNDITPAWLRKYEVFLTGEDKKQSTIAILLRTLRAAINRALAEGLIRQSDYPFGRGKFEIQEGAGRKLALPIVQIGQIARYDDGDPLTHRYRDYWLFLYLCNGINVADFCQLRYKDIVGGEIRFVRQKTARTSRTRKEIVVVVTEPMQKIMERWGNPRSPEAYIFPILSGKESAERKVTLIKNTTRAINQRMEKVGEALGLGSITTYTARHSFATVLKRAGANIAYISESLGHSNLRTTEHYLASFERDEREKNAALLTQW